LPFQLRGARSRAHEVVEDALAVDRLAGREVPRAHAVAGGEGFPRLHRAVCWISHRVQGRYAKGHPQAAEAVAIELPLDVLVRVRLPEAGNDRLARGVDDPAVVGALVQGLSVRLDALDAVVPDDDVDIPQLVGPAPVPETPCVDYGPAGRLVRPPGEVDRHVACRPAAPRDEAKLPVRQVEKLLRISTPGRRVRHLGVDAHGGPGRQAAGPVD